ncbi:MAG TPA: hypothetical protein VJB57_08280 [Dehalococcoidia bacterium]|nr:hypothetical protein [Dehalococcoidia bacterium]
MDSLFSSDRKLPYRPRDFSEPVYAFLDGSVWPSFSRLREFWDGWFVEYPPENRKPLAARFQSPSEHRHLSAALELLTFAVLKQGGYGVQVEPPVGDYLLEFLATGRNHDFFVECTVTGQSQIDASADALEAQFLDVLNKTPVLHHLLSLSFEARGSSAPPGKKLRAELAKWAELLDSGLALASETPFHWNHEGWRVAFHALPLKDGEEADGTAIGMTINTFDVKESLRLRGALDGKASKYGILGKPLLVVVGSTEFQRDVDLWDAVLGDRVWDVHHNSNEVTERRIAKGVFGHVQRPRNTTMSAVLHAPFRSHSFASGETELSIIHHPFADVPFPQGLFPFVKEYDWDPAGKAAAIEPTATVADYFNLGVGWPHFDQDPHRLSPHEYSWA